MRSEWTCSWLAAGSQRARSGLMADLAVLAPSRLKRCARWRTGNDWRIRSPDVRPCVALWRALLISPGPRSPSGRAVARRATARYSYARGVFPGASAAWPRARTARGTHAPVGRHVLRRPHVMTALPRDHRGVTTVVTTPSREHRPVHTAARAPQRERDNKDDGTTTAPWRRALVSRACHVRCGRRCCSHAARNALVVPVGAGLRQPSPPATHSNASC